jgi:xanthine dehydrogenase accessory factor
MRTLWPQLRSWLDAEEPFALATIVSVSGSAPRVPGACMAIMPESNRFIGSVSSGCLDSEVVEAATRALRTGEVVRLLFGPEGNPPWSEGLTCGGEVEVRVERWWGCDDRAGVRSIAAAVRSWLESGASGVVLSRGRDHLAIDAGGARIGMLDSTLSEVADAAAAHLAEELPPCAWPDAGNGPPVFVRTIRREPRLVIVGAGDVTVSLVALAQSAGYATIVIDPRAAFTATDRFIQQPTAVHHGWPQRIIPDLALGPREAAVVLTHDPKIDDPALLALLQTPVGHIGALGGKRSHAARLERLRVAIADPSTLDRIHAPAGIHLRAPHARGVATGILAGLVQWQAEDDRARLARSIPGRVSIAGS